ncbi:hypothetical protein RUND412_006484 [Rhizina undulata]
MLMYDNFDVYREVKDERLHNKNILHHNTISAVVFLRRKNGNPWQMIHFKEPVVPPRRTQFGPPLIEIERPDAEKETETERDKEPGINYAIPPRQSWIQEDKLADFTARDILDPLWTTLSVISQRSRLPCELLIPISGDQLTIQRIRTLKYVREYDDALAANRLKWIYPIAGLFHVRMAIVRMIFEARSGREDGRDPISLRRIAQKLGRNKIFGSNGKMDFHAANSLLLHVAQALILAAAQVELGVSVTYTDSVNKYAGFVTYTYCVNGLRD